MGIKEGCKYLQNRKYLEVGGRRLINVGPICRTNAGNSATFLQTKFLYVSVSNFMVWQCCRWGLVRFRHNTSCFDLKYRKISQHLVRNTWFVATNVRVWPVTWQYIYQSSELRHFDTYCRNTDMIRRTRTNLTYIWFAFYSAGCAVEAGVGEELKDRRKEDRRQN